MNLSSRHHAAELDAADPLARYRDLFALPDGVLYFDGNSLGPLPHAARARLIDTVDRQWGEGLIRSWNRHRWIDLPRTVGAKIARLIGASSDEVLVADSTSVNLFKLLSAALELRPDRRVIVCPEGDFPTDRYLAQGMAGSGSAELRLVDPDRLLEALDDRVAVLLMSHVHYQTAAIADLATFTRAAHEHGALVLWDLSHAVGAIEIELGRAGVDLAVGCTYKYLNGGPGAPAFLYVARALQEQARSPLPGWLGHAEPFAFARDYQPAPGVDRFQCGTPPILSLAALDAALDVFEDVDLAAVRDKSLALARLFDGLLGERCAGFELEIAGPEDATARGSHLSIRHPHGFEIVQALIEHGVIGDFRPPDLMRFAFTPLYQRFIDVWDAVEILRRILEERRWQDPRYAERGKVT